MRIQKLRILNYKSFNDSGWINFSDGFNVIVGKNSSGKTALLEAFRVFGLQDRPHLSLDRRREASLTPQSSRDFEISFAENELKDALLRINSIIFPIKNNGNSNKQQLDAGRIQVDQLFGAAGQSLSFGVSQGVIHPNQYPSHGFFSGPSSGQSVCVVVNANREAQSYRLAGPQGSNQDTVLNLVADLIPRKVYVFKAERLNIGEIGFSEDKILNDNAANLPRVLLSMMTTNPSLFDRYNRHVNEIFPYIKRVTVVPKGQNVEVRLWWVDTSTERDDLAIPLLESGTGVGQALAILYVAMTISDGVIVVDEPSSFLHPGAAKKLIEILRQYRHQYIVSTHSPEIIAAADPDALFVVRWDAGDSHVQRVEKTSINKQREILSEIGVSAADVFGADQIVWVEGQTEEECFPIVLQHAIGSMPQGLDFLAVRSVDELVKKGGIHNVIMDVYRKLTDASAILPKPLHFSFDRETRPQDQISKIEADTKGAVKFLPARCYECFLLHPRAIAAVLTAELMQLSMQPVALSDVNAWFDLKAANFNTRHKFMGVAVNNDEWVKTVDAVALLTSLFQELCKLPYSKMRHSRALTEWILSNDPTFLKTLSTYVEDLAKN